jgi:radical SAM superfamily enzyme YgiQ (UPF0313 family)
VERWGIDTIFDGEGEKLIVELVKRALDGEPLPKYIYVGVQEAPSLDEISTIKVPKHQRACGRSGGGVQGAVPSAR